jgi:putative Holliday junction resolvase
MDTLETSAIRAELKHLAIDFGESRVGLAISVPATTIALPLGVVVRRSDRQLLEEIARIAEEEAVGVLVIGDPRGPNGRPGTASERVRRFADKLERRLRLPIVWIDETLTTAAAQERLRRPAQRRRPPREALDAIAAQILLEEALSRSPPQPLSADGGAAHRTTNGDDL